MNETPAPSNDKPKPIAVRDSPKPPSPAGDKSPPEKKPDKPSPSKPAPAPRRRGGGLTTLIALGALLLAGYNGYRFMQAEGRLAALESQIQQMAQPDEGNRVQTIARRQSQLEGRVDVLDSRLDEIGAMELSPDNAITPAADTPAVATAPSGIADVILQLRLEVINMRLLLTGDASKAAIQLRTLSEIFAGSTRQTDIERHNALLADIERLQKLPTRRQLLGRLDTIATLVRTIGDDTSPRAAPSDEATDEAASEPGGVLSLAQQYGGRLLNVKYVLSQGDRDSRDRVLRLIANMGLALQIYDGERYNSQLLQLQQSIPTLTEVMSTQAMRNAQEHLRFLIDTQFPRYQLTMIN